MKRDRTLWLVLLAMVMFTAGVVVVIGARDLSEHLLGAVAVLGALAVVIANVFGNGKRDE